jgi:endogenous inhibitor of DNA gyrase (YacG/DUF329 family)
MADEAGHSAGSARSRCPICRRPSEPGFRPFCSARCRDQDLLNWLRGHYAVPVLETEEDGAEPEDRQDG